jgi:hypothetical protein
MYANKVDGIHDRLLVCRNGESHTFGRLYYVPRSLENSYNAIAVIGVRVRVYTTPGLLCLTAHLPPMWPFLPPRWT